MSDSADAPTRHCTNGDCEEEMILYAGFFVCEACDMIVPLSRNPENTP